MNFHPPVATRSHPLQYAASTRLLQRGACSKAYIYCALDFSAGAIFYCLFAIPSMLQQSLTGSDGTSCLLNLSQGFDDCITCCNADRMNNTHSWTEIDKIGQKRVVEEAEYGTGDFSNGKTWEVQP